MAKTKNRVLIVLACIMLLAFGLFALAACGGNRDYTVTFMVQDAETGEWEQYNTAQTTDGKVDLPSAPTRDDYVFRNWYETQDGTGDPFTGENVDGDMTVYAYFAPVLVDIHLNSDDPQEVRLEQLNELTEQYTSEALSMGLTFDGWYTNAACTENYDDANDDVTDLYGRYMAEITFNNGYEDVASQRVVAGSGATAPSATEIANSYPYMDSEDMTFTDSEGNVIDFNSATFNTNTTITVMWKSPYISYDPINGQPGYYSATISSNDMYNYAGGWPVMSFLSQNVTVDDSGTKGNVKSVSLSTMGYLTSLKKIIFADGIEYINGFNGNNTGSQVESIKLPSTLIVLEEAFSSHPNLTGIELPEGIRVIIDSLWANDGVSYDYDIAIPDSVINCSSIPSNFTFSANSCFVKEGEGAEAIIYKNEEDGTKTLVAYYNIENGFVEIPEGYDAIQVGIFTNFEIQFAILPEQWSVKYNENVEAVNSETGERYYTYYTGSLLYNSSNVTTFTGMNEKAYSILTRLNDRIDYVILRSEAWPENVSPYVICGRGSTIMSPVVPCNNETLADKIKYAPIKQTGEDVVVTVNAYNSVTQETSVIELSAKAGDALSIEQIREAIANELGDTFEAESINLESCTQFGEVFDDGVTLNCNQYIDVEYSLNSLGFLYRLNEEGTGYVVYDFDAGSALHVSQGYIVQIPDDINGTPVVEIADSAFEGEQALYRVYIGSNVVRIGNRAFANTPYLTSVQVTPGSLSVIGESAFENAGSSFNASTGKYVAKQTLTIQIPLATLTEIQPYAFKSIAIAEFTPVVGEEFRKVNTTGTVINEDLIVGGYYYQSYQSGSGNIMILRYTGQTESGSPIDTDGSKQYKIFDVELVAVAAGYNDAQMYSMFGVEIGYSNTSASGVDWVIRYRVLEGSVYYIDNSWTQGIIFGIVSYVEENAFTDCDLNSISFRYHEKAGDTWIDDELLKTNSNTIFAEGWFNGIHSTDDEYEQLLTKLEAATADSSTLHGWWL